MNKTGSAHSLVFGGTRGIGRALVKVFAEAAHTVSAIGRRRPADQDQVAGQVRYWAVDLADHPRLPATLNEIVREHGKLNNVVFLQRYRGNEDHWKRELDVSLTATRNAIESLTDCFVDDGDRSIVIVSSLASRGVAREQPVSWPATMPCISDRKAFESTASRLAPCSRRRRRSFTGPTKSCPECTNA